MKKQLVVVVAAVAVLVGAVCAVSALWGETVWEPFRSEQVAPEPSGPSFWPAKNTLRTTECRYWLGFSC